MKKLPKRLFITIVDKDEGGFPIASDTFTEFDDGVEIGTYELVEKSKKKIDHSLVNTKAKKAKKRSK